MTDNDEVLKRNEVGAFPPRIGVCLDSDEFMDAHFYKIEQAGGLTVGDTEYLSTAELEFLLEAAVNAETARCIVIGAEQKRELIDEIDYLRRALSKAAKGES